MNSNNQIRLIFLADTHLGFDYPIRPRIERRRRGQDFFDNFQRVLDFAVETRADFVIHGGDFFYRAKIPAKIVDLAYEKLLKFADKNIPIYIVPGNHERSKLPTSLYFNHPNIYIFHYPKTFVVERKNAKIAITGFPCQRNNIRDQFKTILHKADKKEPADIKLLCMHQTVENSKIETYTFRSGKDIIPLKNIPGNFHAILSGHIHRKQILSKESGVQKIPIIYPGSIERTSFMEKNEDKGFFEIVFTHKNEKWEIDYLKFHILPTRPMEDLLIEQNINIEVLKSYLFAKLSKYDKNAIIRLKCDPNLDQGIKAKITPKFLRETFSKSLNFQISADFFRNNI
jgi:DNA repair protein SbcD/Mre11